jgi:hypothetical protein
MDDF